MTSKAPAILGVHLFDGDRRPVRVGTITRDGDGAVAFNPSETYVRDTERPILSLAWYVPESNAQSIARMGARNDKIGVNGSLPPWFAGLLPEGSLRELVLTEMGPGNHDEFDVLTRLGADLPGAVLIIPETDTPPSVGPLDLMDVAGFEAAVPGGMVKFSLAGVQLKFTANPHADKLTVPGRGETGRCIIKVGTQRYPGLPEAEYGAMQLAKLIGVNTADCRLVPRAQIDGIPEDLLAHNDTVLVVDRFDRTAAGLRVHIEDAAQIFGALGERKYTMATTETIIRMVGRFSTDRRFDILEAVRRVVADILIGNGDNHLKNWSFRFPGPGEIRLSPAYDIVPTILFQPRDRMALKFVGTNDFDIVNLHRFERVAKYLDLDPKQLVGEVVRTVRRAIDLWPEAAPALLGDERAEKILARLCSLRLVDEVTAARVPTARDVGDKPLAQ
ncbi:type II toxin-antitoxin system HipA family toxin [Blastomonas sp. AAP53]|uniref:type II toxin-antitoxin system HipA family toxin n=1 Tax=Blastomonas sp. AAP53 TaxID=1248760 RepID=UPI000318DA53|nr:type II toxin-antitoxin system HipA family toxin [Blastomonas sp. AAP53]